LEKLLRQAQKSARAAEVFSLDQVYDILKFENGRLKNIESSMQSGISLRLIKDGRLGFAYTKDRGGGHEQLVQNALASLRAGTPAAFSFSRTVQVKDLSTYDPALESVSCTDIAAESERVIAALSKLTKAQLNATAARQTSIVRVLNSTGTDVQTRSTYYHFDIDLIFPSTNAAISHLLVDKSYATLSDTAMQKLAWLYEVSAREITPPRGRMQVMFMPESMYALIWPLQSAMNGRTVYRKESPVADKLEQQIFDPGFSCYDDPLDDRLPGARSFDDEGTPCRRLEIVENGHLKNFFYDLNYAAKAKRLPTGHGYRAWDWDPVTTKPGPSLNHFFIKTGDISFEQLVKAMDRGIIVFGCLGAHSGNILNGDFSIGLSPGLYVENGEIQGRVKNAMVSGNIYDLMKNVIGIENEAHPTHEGVVPAILFESAMVAVQ
jgi:PmbA protein